MKALKISLIALSFGFFAVSCGETTEAETTTPAEVENTVDNAAQTIENAANEATETIDSAATEAKEAVQEAAAN